MSRVSAAAFAVYEAMLDTPDVCAVWCEPGRVLGAFREWPVDFVLLVRVGEPETEADRADVDRWRQLGWRVAVVHDVPGAIDTVAKWRREIAAERGTP